MIHLGHCSQKLKQFFGAIFAKIKI